MESSEFVKTQLVNYTNADSFEVEAKNNRYHYHLTFRQDIGWDWVYAQIQKISAELTVSVEMWEIHPGDEGEFIVEVREVERRKAIDDSQRGLTDFEE